jgi:hypothetical protein
MKKTKLFYHRHATSNAQVFAQRMSEYLSKQGPVVRLSVKEGSFKHDMVVVITTDEQAKKESEQEVLVSVWVNVHDLEAFVDNLNATRKVVDLGVFTSTLSSKRSAVIAVVECGSGRRQEADQEPDAHKDVSADGGAAEGSKSIDRGVDEQSGDLPNDPSLHQEVRSNAGKKAGVRKGGSRKRNPPRGVESASVVRPEEGTPQDVSESSDS